VEILHGRQFPFVISNCSSRTRHDSLGYMGEERGMESGRTADRGTMLLVAAVILAFGMILGAICSATDWCVRTMPIARSTSLPTSRCGR
jgi:hypothetical protein